MNKLLCLVLIAALLTLGGSVVMAQGSVPPAIPGQAVYVAYPVTIAIDGSLSDWEGLPSVTVDKGPSTSSDPAENGSFTFGVAADETAFYIYMTMPDKTIITGQHGTDYWNEDSLEFYLNLTGNRWASEFTDGIVQYRIIPGDIGKTDIAEITSSGQNVASAPISQAAVFATEDGWGFEAAVPWGSWLKPVHGLEFGFQAQANGASEQDRNVKLIWSAADTQDRSWNTPSLFGVGLIYEIGRSDIPMPSAPPEPTPEPVVEAPSYGFGVVSVNEVGYLPDAAKLGLLQTARTDAAPWSLVDVATGAVVLEGTTTAPRMDESAGEMTVVADFSAWTTPGTYILVIDGVESVPFEIGASIYDTLVIDAARYFYLNRSGIELAPEYAGDWARPAGHITDNDVTCFAGKAVDGTQYDGCDYRLDASGGWYDAGDYGKYVVNGGISLWTLLNLAERYPDLYPDGSLNIPESGNGVSDLLDEARWEMDWMLRMQVPEGEPLAGMAHHKLHDLRWGGMPMKVPTEWDNDSPTNGRYLMPPSTAATLNLAATAAQCARLWSEIDPAFADRCLTAAETAWKAALANPAIFYGSIPGQGGGDYGDRNVADEFFWAAAELYITTGADEYRDYIENSSMMRRFPGLGKGSAMGWPETGALGTISLLSAPNGLSEERIAALEAQIVGAADMYLSWMSGQVYPTPLMPATYDWGSNSAVLNNAIILALAYDITGDPVYRDGVTSSLDYILGRNPLSRSYVTGYGENAPQHPHHRFWGNRPSQGYPPPPPGVVVGGPLETPQEDATRNNAELNAGPAKRYVDMIEAYSSNEVTINWNAPLTWVTAFVAWNAD